MSKPPVTAQTDRAKQASTKAEQTARIALGTVETLRKTEKARGRWARLSAAWRGE